MCIHLSLVIDAGASKSMFLIPSLPALVILNKLVPVNLSSSISIVQISMTSYFAYYIEEVHNFVFMQVTGLSGLVRNPLDGVSIGCISILCESIPVFH